MPWQTIGYICLGFGIGIFSMIAVGLLMILTDQSDIKDALFNPDDNE